MGYLLATRTLTTLTMIFMDNAVTTVNLNQCYEKDSPVYPFGMFIKHAKCANVFSPIIL